MHAYYSVAQLCFVCMLFLGVIAYFNHGRRSFLSKQKQSVAWSTSVYWADGRIGIKVQTTTLRALQSVCTCIAAMLYSQHSWNVLYVAQQHSRQQHIHVYNKYSSCTAFGAVRTYCTPRRHHPLYPPFSWHSIWALWFKYGTLQSRCFLIVPALALLRASQNANIAGIGTILNNTGVLNSTGGIQGWLIAALYCC